MTKRGRKPKERKGYFYEEQEDAIVKYINETDEAKKNKIFNTVLCPALTKMIESIIRRYKLFVPDEDFEHTFNDTLSYLLTKINHFKPEIYCYDPYNGNTENITFIDMTESEFREKVKSAEETDPEFIRVNFNEDESECLFKKVLHKYKAYSYCGTVCVNYLKYKCTQFSKKKVRDTSYDDMYDDLSKDENFTTNEESFSSHAENLISSFVKEIENIIHNKNNYFTPEELKLGKSIVELFKNWETILPNDGSKKLQKSTILYYLREDTMMDTKELRDNLKTFKMLYKTLKEKEMK